MYFCSFHENVHVVIFIILNKLWLADAEFSSGPSHVSKEQSYSKIYTSIFYRLSR